MNYTNYIIKRQPFQPELLISDRRGWREVTTAFVLPAAIVALIGNIVLIPVAWFIDCGRGVKLSYYRYQAKKRRQAYVRCVLRSLDREDDEHTASLLMAA